MFFSVVIPTYNRLPILTKCLDALEKQTWDGTYEVVVVDDGSTDGTVPFLQTNPARFPHLRLIEQNHGGPAVARNLGVREAKGDTVVFIDSDLVVTEVFLAAHHQALTQAGSDRVFTYGRVVNTANFEQPTQESYKITDFSAAYFATGNVAIQRKWLLEAGLFDEGFTLYGWEDLELGVRLKKLGLKLIKCPQAVGYHWHPAFRLQQLPRLIQVEYERGRMGVRFYRKHPTWQVKMMIQMTPLHQTLWGALSLGGLLNEKTLAPVLQFLVDQGRPQLALELARIFLNWYNVQGVYAAFREQQS
ncbi:glycosyltransferase family 2 protein [Candidatus Cyanaurora vandensis]|uniref:glycosyltransferase family 2 protein n=1 Tax=Candidatus Cyanaurora vandensis TaxID=2714958 RepID=UPI00257FB8C0|nr:glycosyltransferase family A protein [Candidatus Cyanaurora vandensis]